MKKSVVLFLCLLFISGLGFYFFVIKNDKILFGIAEGLNNPSYLHNIVIKQIYNLPNDKKLNEKIRNYLEQCQNVHLHDLYIQFLGIRGDSSSAGILIKKYSKYQHDIDSFGKINRIIDAMGLISNDDLIPFLEKLLRDYEELGVQATKYSIARSLYLITGKKYSYIDYSDRNTELQITKELIEARDVIMDSKGRKRNLQEMLSLDKLYRPPKNPGT